jgi:hypothetical protein
LQKLVALGLSAALAVAGLGLTADASNAGSRHYNYNQPHHHHGKGLRFGLSFGNPYYFGVPQYYGLPGPFYRPYYRPYVAPYAYRPYGYGRTYAWGGGHVQRCIARYRTYNPATDMYYRRPGVLARCRL